MLLLGSASGIDLPFFAFEGEDVSVGNEPGGLACNWLIIEEEGVYTNDMMRSLREIPPELS